MRHGTLRAGAYLLDTNASSHAALIEGLERTYTLSGSERTFSTGGHKFMLSEVNKHDEVTVAQFTKLRDQNLPVAVQADGETRAEIVADDEYVGEESLVCLANNLRIALIQRTKFSPSRSGAAELLAAAGDFDSDSVLSMESFMTPNAIADISTLDRGAKLDLSAWVAPALAEDLLGEQSNARAIEAPDGELVLLKLSVSVGNSQEKSIEPSVIQRILTKVKGADGTKLTSAKASGWSATGEKIGLDFLEGLIDTEARYSYPDSDRTIPFSARKSAIIEVYEKVKQSMAEKARF